MRTLEDENITCLAYYKGIKTNKQQFFVAVAVKGEKYPLVKIINPGKNNIFSFNFSHLKPKFVIIDM